MEPTIIQKEAFSLVGRRTRMSLNDNLTKTLWLDFRKELHSIIGTKKVDFYSVERYDALTYFSSFDPNKQFEKWAAIEKEIAPNSAYLWDEFPIEKGLYAVFNYKGHPQAAHKFYQFILEEWLPKSTFQLDHRPHIAKMGEKYQNDSDDSEEEIWIPIVQPK